MEKDYIVDLGNGYFEIEKEVGGLNKEEVSEKLADNYGFEIDRSGEDYHLSKDSVEIHYIEDKAVFRAEYDEKPEEWLVAGISKILEGENIPVDMDYFEEKPDENIEALQKVDFPYEIDDGDTERYQGVSTKPSPRL